MKLTLRSALISGLFMALITACATTELTSAWKDPSYNSQPRKILVIGIARKPAIKRIFEDEFVRQLKAKGTDAIAGYTVMPDARQNDHGFIAGKMKEQGADSLLISRLTSKKTVKTYVPGTVYHPPEKYGSWRDYYGHGSDEVYTPGYIAEDQYALMESNLYDAGSNRLIWSAASETEILGSDQDQIKSYIGVMVNVMAERKLLK